MTLFETANGEWIVGGEWVVGGDPVLGKFVVSRPIGKYSAREWIMTPNTNKVKVFESEAAAQRAANQRNAQAKRLVNRSL